MVQRVTVAVDGGPASDAALAWVIDRARTMKVAVQITSVIGVDFAPPSDDSDYRNSVEPVLERARERVAAELPRLEVTTKIRHGLAHEALISASAHTDLLVVGTNKTSALAGIMHGTLALKVAGASDCTTVVVPANWAPSDGPVVAGWADDATSETALDFAAKEASRRKAALTIVHTWTAPPLAPVDGVASAALVEEVIASSHVLLDAAAHRIRLAYPTMNVTAHIAGGPAAVAIVEAAAGAALVVVGSRGHGAVAGFFLGSVSHGVLLNMPAPVAVIPRADEPIDVYPDLVDDTF